MHATPHGLVSTLGGLQDTFLFNWEVFTEHMLQRLNWDNVLAAGGSVAATLRPLPKAYAKNARTRRALYHRTPEYASSDIDLFLYGLTSEKEANAKLEEIFETVADSIPTSGKVMVCRSTHAVTIFSSFPYRHVQIITRLYKSPAEILAGFDVDACAVGFNGRDVLAMPRAHHALITQTNRIDLTRRSPTYEMRLAKCKSVWVPVGWICARGRG
jgi:hypothetical protein